MPLDPQSFDNIRLCSNAFSGFGDLMVYHAQLLKIEAQLAYFFEQQSLQDRAYSWVMLQIEADLQFSRRYGL